MGVRRAPCWPPSPGLVRALDDVVRPFSGGGGWGVRLIKLRKIGGGGGGGDKTLRLCGGGGSSGKPH